MHVVLGAGKSDGAMDAANLLKPMLARGELRTIGATTLAEYRQHIEKDAAFERRFQMVQVGEPNVPDTIQILRGLKQVRARAKGPASRRTGGAVFSLESARAVDAWSPALGPSLSICPLDPQPPAPDPLLPPPRAQKYEDHHGVHITDRALVVAAELSDRRAFGGCMSRDARARFRRFSGIYRECTLRSPWIPQP